MEEVTTFTATDIENANKFARVNLELHFLRALNKKAPHIFSWVDVEIKDATEADYPIPRKIKHLCKVITISFNKNFCDKISCVSQKEKSLCDVNEPASNYRIGDDTQFGVQCQPACFHFLPDKKIKYSDVDNKPAPQMLPTNWNERAKKCKYLHPTAVTNLEKPYWRSQIHYEKRVNDMPTGYSMKLAEYPYGSGRSYELNKTYCSYYERGFENGSCVVNGTMDKVLDIVVGLSVVNNIRSGIHMWKNKNSEPFELPSGLPEIPEVDPKYSLKAWKEDINHNFKIPEPIKSTHRRKRNILDEVKDVPEDIVKFMLKIMESGPLLGLLGGYLIQHRIDMTILQIRNVMTSIISKFESLLTKSILESLENIGETVIFAGLRGVITRAIADVALITLSKFAIGMIKFIGMFADGIGIALAASFVVDIILSKVDPTGLETMASKVAPDYYMQQTEYLLRQHLGSATMDVEYDHFKILFLDKEEVKRICFESIGDTITYLNALELNSNGSRIDKGKKFNVGKSVAITPQYQAAKDAVLAKRVRFDENVFEEYNDSFEKRIKINKYIKYASLSILGLIGVFSLVKLYIICFALIIILALILTAGRVEIMDDSIVESI